MQDLPLGGGCRLLLLLLLSAPGGASALRHGGAAAAAAAKAPPPPTVHGEAPRANVSAAVDLERRAPDPVEDAVPWPAATPRVRGGYRQFVVPVMVLAAGGLLMVAKQSMRTFSQLLLFFGAQAFMNLYMKAVLSTSVVQASPLMKGFQAPLLLTALQQLVSFGILAAAMLVLKLLGMGFRPRPVSTWKEWAMILFLAVCFSGNVALNNFSLSLIDISANLMIRSTSPMTALLLQLVFRSWFEDALRDMRAPKLLFMLAGVASAAVVVYSKSHSAQTDAGEHYLLGVVLCISSVASSSMELILVVLIGRTIKLNALETILYTSLPVAAILAVPSFCLTHTVAYHGHQPSTDWGVLMEVWRLSPSTVALAFLSGLFALCYNVLLYVVVADLSPFYTSFAANVNKVGAIALAVIFGFEALPAKPWGYVMVLAVACNVSAFAAFSLWPARGTGKA